MTWICSRVQTEEEQQPSLEALGSDARVPSQKEAALMSQMQLLQVLYCATVEAPL